MNKTTLRSRPLSFRSGYPLSSDEVNEGFDNLIYDLCNILSTEFPDLTTGTFKNYIDVMKFYGEQASMSLLGQEEEAQVDVGGYTKDWRRM